MNITELVTENRRRRMALAAMDYDPVTGDPRDPSRRPERRGGRTLYLPVTMLSDPHYSCSLTDHDFDMLRFRHDFEYWAFRCVIITDKLSMEDVPLRLNRPQRRLAGILERERVAGRPVRLIMLKARQWGGSTLVQVYFAWIQTVHRRNWHSLICAHVKDTASSIRGMYAKLLSCYPQQYWPEECAPEFRPFERMNNTRYIPGRGCKVTVCSSETQESARGLDCALAHLSEVAFWKDSTLHNPADLLRSVASGIARKPLSVIVMESTANGVGNFFHREWMRATDPEGSDKLPFFVPWFEIEIYTEPLEEDEVEELWLSLDDYGRELWLSHGCTLEAIKWYQGKRREFEDHRAMMAEFPSTPDEAFACTSFNVFSAGDVGRLRLGCDLVRPERGEVKGSPRGVPSDISSPVWVPSADGMAKVWSHPRPGGVYIAAVDIGGRTRSADYSVISVIDRHLECPDGKPEVVAQWRGHIDHDLLGWKSAAMARWYNNALLVIESNSWETSSEGHGHYILDTLAGKYRNLYRRREPGRDGPGLPGFHTNRSTKPAIIAHLVSLVRENGYVEREHAACDELLEYEQLPDGGYAARRGCHDDILMSRAIALWVHATVRRTRPLSREDIRALAMPSYGVTVR